MQHMVESVLTPSRRFDQAWDRVVPEDKVSEASEVVTGEAGFRVVVKASEEPYVTGSLRPRVRILKVLEEGEEVATLKDINAIFASGDSQVLEMLTKIEDALPA